MSTEQPSKRTLSFLGYGVLLTFGAAGIWLATIVIIPGAYSEKPAHGDPTPAFFDFARQISDGCLYSVGPIAFVGTALLIISLLRRGPARFVAGCQAALPLLAGFTACLAFYLLASGGLAMKLAMGDQMSAVNSYKRTLAEYALLDQAEGKLEKHRVGQLLFGKMKPVKVRSVSEFTNAEARERVASLVAILPEASDAQQKRQILATICLFRERGISDYQVKNLPRYATEAGAPQTESAAEALKWIAANLHKDGWEPLPLYKFRFSE